MNAFEERPDLPAVASTVHANFMALAATAPGLTAQWEAHLQTYYPGFSVEQLSKPFTGFGYQDTSVFIDRVMSLLTQGETRQLTAFFRQVDYMLTCDDHRTAELTGMGLIEGLQNQLTASPFDHHTALDAWLLPTTKQFWDDLNDSWEEK